MSAAGLQGFTVQRLVFIHQADHSDLGVGQFEQCSIVTVRICDHSPASIQAYGQTEQNPDQNQGHSPGRNCQLDHHLVWITDGHISVNSHYNEHSVSSGTKHMCSKSLHHTFWITDKAFRGRPQGQTCLDVCKQKPNNYCAADVTSGNNSKMHIDSGIIEKTFIYELIYCNRKKLFPFSSILHYIQQGATPIPSSSSSSSPSSSSLCEEQWSSLGPERRSSSQYKEH
ncbi:hypothetical protein F7725_006407 [Dissostichus mawsoni]|uniref:Uncharacterized protein n=1 Tax=Dissostichus mawsoni TaxID=36200 RepID=A0A7J5XTU7_DISMA|nr:hypothetical protein F7725_006407 [Dissostichus mawsoni]